MKSVYRIVRFNHKYRIIIRNHWSGSFSGRFLIKIGSERQGWDTTIYYLGLFNFLVCFMVCRNND